MADPDHLIGRFAKIVDYEDGSWNDAYVQLRSYNAKGATYEVAYNDGEEVFHLRTQQLELCSPAAFLSRFPNAPVIKGRHDMSDLPHGAVMDFSLADPTVVQKAPHATIKGRCRIVGKKITESSINVNTINNHIIVKARDNELVEFDSLYFEPLAPASWNIECVSGQIAFRNCAFNNSRKGVTVGDGAHTVRVTFESCVFKNLREYAVLVQSGSVDFVNCAFHHIGRAVVVKENARIELHHSNFASCIGGVAVPQRGHARVFSTQFDRMVDFCVYAAKGADVFLEDCTVNSCDGCVVVLQGSGCPDATIADCMLRDCHIGVRIGRGYCAASMGGNEFEDCDVDIYVAADTRGEVTIGDKYTSLDEKFVNLSSEKCLVCVDDIEELPNTQIERLIRHSKLHEERSVKYHYGHISSGACERVLVSAGVQTQKCAKCHTVAASGVLYKKCAKCKVTRYCSRECQELHWPVHCMLCRVVQLRTHMIETKSYVCCDHCGQVETESEEHYACSRCLGVFYCSKECQKAGWKSHKSVCAECKRPR